MNTRRHPSKIPQQHQHQSAEQPIASPFPSQSNSFHTNLHDQAFILSSDEELVNSSYESSMSLSHKSLNLSRHSSLSSLDQFKSKNSKDSNSVLGCLGHEESEVQHDWNLSQFSDSQVSLIKGLEPLFQGKNLFLRRSKRYGNGIAQQKGSGNQRALFRNQSQSEMIQDQKQVFDMNNCHNNHLINSSKIIQENSQTPPNLFQVVSNPQRKHQPQSPKPYQFSLLTRTTRSSKKLIQQQTQSCNSNNRQLGSSMEQRSSSDPIKPKQSVSKITKDFIIESRKNKKIKKMHQKTFQFGLKNHAKSFKRGYG